MHEVIVGYYNGFLVCLSEIIQTCFYGRCPSVFKLLLRKTSYPIYLNGGGVYSVEEGTNLSLSHLPVRDDYSAQ